MNTATRSPDDLPENASIVLAIGKKSKGKGTDTLLVAMQRVRQIIPDAMLVLLGKSVDRPGDTSRLVIPDYPWLWNVDSVPKEEVPAWIDAARVVCCPSASYDSYPRAVLEAMSGARAVVGTDAPGGMRELIEDGVTGYLVPRMNPDALADALIKALDLTTAIRMGVAGYKRVRDGAMQNATASAANEIAAETLGVRAGWSLGDFMLLPMLALAFVFVWPMLAWDWLRGR